MKEIIVAGILIVLLGQCVFLKEIVGRVTLNLAVGRTSLFLKLLDKIISKKAPEQEKELQSRRETGTKWLHEFQGREEVSVCAKDGVRLRGHYFCNPQAKRIVVLFHGWRGSWDTDCGFFGKMLYERKCSLLLVEQRAHGKSGGKYIGFGIKERFDCKKWAEYIAARSREKDLPIYLGGVSMGAATVLMATELQLPERVRGVIADCGFTTPYEMVRIFAKKVLRIDENFILEAVNRICKKIAGYSFKEGSTLSAMKKCRIPIFFAHGTKDNFVPCEMTRRNFEACRAKKHLLLVEGADHVQSFLVNPAQYMKELEDFLFFS